MRNSIKLRTGLAAAAGLVLCFGEASAEEGMWRPDQLPDLRKELRAAGLKVDPKKLAALDAFPMNAIISLGFCSGSFVSPEGLVATNHHCAYGSIQYNSKEDANLLADGFLAASKTEELAAAPGTRVYVTVGYDEVTGRVLDGLSDETPPRERYQAIEDREKAIIAECEEDPGHRCSVKSFHGGAEYFLIKSLEVKDVRLVYAPAGAIGKYGGDVDNWQWPRHTGDFAFFRAYVAPNGAPAPYAEENVPYRPDGHLKIAADGVAEGDFVMAAGYPGRTYRYRRLAEVENQFSFRYPTGVELLGDWIDTIEKSAADDEDAQIKYASRIAGLNNALKNYKGQLEGAEKVGLAQRRAAREAALDAWIAENPSAKAKYAGAIADLDALIAEQTARRVRDRYTEFASNASMLDAAKKIYRFAKEREKPDAAREPGFQDRDRAFIEQSLAAIDRRFDAKVDKAVWLYFLKRYVEEVPAEGRIAALDEALDLGAAFDEAAVLRKLDRLYAETKLIGKVARLGHLNDDAATIEASQDPFLQLAVALYDHDIAEEEREKTIAGRRQILEPKYMEAIIAYQKEQGQEVYPDANSTLRVTYGAVKGVPARDGLYYTPFTTLEGIEEKHTGQDPFASPARQRALTEARDYGDYEMEALGSVPVNYLSTLDVTGGNSGSATLNARGEFVGMLFDGTYESINADWDFDPTTTRTIHVDHRYMLWVMEKVDGATSLLEEMGVK